ncbi:hypothetical protein [Thalassobaculum salexigens]|uniref:hypothetical protein n=1 Tax=Thalassobaculum salexigens TaxID=455360 RepID=UPI0012EBB22F|nr:hypothetical protein [Thalassobaculum salexigens]
MTGGDCSAALPGLAASWDIAKSDAKASCFDFPESMGLPKVRRQERAFGGALTDLIFGASASERRATFEKAQLIVYETLPSAVQVLSLVDLA